MNAMRPMKRARVGGVRALLVALIVPCALQVWASPSTPGDLTILTTRHSIGIEWDIGGDTNHDATCTVEYRIAGSGSAWQQSMGLIRVDYSGENKLAGSIMFLDPGVSYEVRVALTDPDGGAESREQTVATRADVVPQDQRIVHVAPGAGGGSGSSGDPYLGLATAWAVAQPGDTLLMHAGDYGGVTDATAQSGDDTNPIAIRAAGDGEVQLSFLEIFRVSNIWIEGLVFRFDGSSDTGLYSSLLNAGYDNGFQSMPNQIDGISVVDNEFYGFKHGIRAGPRTANWYVADNFIEGDRTLGMTGTESFDSEGVELGHGSHHEVAYNSITLVGDGVSFPDENCDIYGNDIYDVTDDGVELDTGQSNTRMWENRIHNASHNGVGFQPQNDAPWYIVRNQIVNVQESIFKFRNTDRFVAMHNTFVNHGRLLNHWSDHLLNGITRNNLWISVDDGPIWSRAGASQTWRTDLDYDGFDYGSNGQPFDYEGQKYDLNGLQQATGQLLNAILVDHDTCFAQFDVPGPPPLTTIPPQHITLDPSCNAVDAGEVIPGFNDGFAGSGPDLGAYEVGKSLPLYGRRTSQSPRAPVLEVQ